jgi:hypothetical protein
VSKDGCLLERYRRVGEGVLAAFNSSTQTIRLDLPESEARARGTQSLLPIRHEPVCFPLGPRFPISDKHGPLLRDCFHPIEGCSTAETCRLGHRQIHSPLPFGVRRKVVDHRRSRKAKPGRPR